MPHVTPTQFVEVGHIIAVVDGIAKITGLENAFMGELILLKNINHNEPILSIALNLEENLLSTVILGNDTFIQQGDLAERTEKLMSINVDNGFGTLLPGHVIDSLGNFIDGTKTDLLTNLISRPIEVKAPGIIDRESVTEALQTGTLAIDSMIPIGCGQRELIIGDRQTGKTAIAIDAIINQEVLFNPIKKFSRPIDLSIYVAIGQKQSSIAQIVHKLNDLKAFNNTIVVAATAADPAPLQFLAPYAGATIGEYFRDYGYRVLIIYDDLSKQAVAYRQMSLLLRRPPGREACLAMFFIYILVCLNVQQK